VLINCFVAELKAMKEKMLKMEQLLEEKKGSQQQKPITKGNPLFSNWQ